MNKFYLGDSVYVETITYPGGQQRITLTTENGYPARNRIVLEPEVYRALTEYLRSKNFHETDNKRK